MYAIRSYYAQVFSPEAFGKKEFPRIKASIEKGAVDAKELAELLRQARVDFGILTDEPGSGIESYWVGQRQLFSEQARRTVDALDHAGAKTILTLCGEDLGVITSYSIHYTKLYD